MALKDDLESRVDDIFTEKWTSRDGQKVPSPDDLKLGNDAVKLYGVVLYADLSESTKLVDTKNDWFAAEIYKSYLHCAGRIITDNSGVITAYDGDRVMAVFHAGNKFTNAAKAALRINYAKSHIINPKIKEKYPKSDYQINHTIGVDASNLFIARTGIRGSNDLVWVGRAANHAAKLCDLPKSHAVRITKTVYDKMLDTAKTSHDGESMWESMTWNDMNRTIYRSNWWWTA
jgi:class 3 adenylate cyclase